MINIIWGKDGGYLLNDCSVDVFLVILYKYFVLEKEYYIWLFIGDEGSYC